MQGSCFICSNFYNYLKEFLSQNWNHNLMYSLVIHMFFFLNKFNMKIY